MDNYGFIYITTNKLNNKKYIGQKKFISGWENYLGSGKHLKNAIKKYGAENFKREIIEVCASKEELDECEKKWISHFNSVESDEFYNIAKGGEGGVTWEGCHPMQGKKMSNESIEKMLEHRVYSSGSQHHFATQVEYMNTGEVGCISEIQKIANVNNLSKFLSKNNGYYRYKNGKNKGKEFRYCHTEVTEEMRKAHTINKVSESLKGQKRHSKMVTYVNENITMCITDIAKYTGVGAGTLATNLRKNNGHYIYQNGKHKGKEFIIKGEK